MAITRRWQSGAEHGNLVEVSSYVGAPSASVVQKKTGNYSFLVSSFQDSQYLIVAIPATRQIRVGFWCYATLNLVGTIETNMFFIRNGTTELAALEVVASTGANILEVAGTNRDTETGVVGTNTWYHYGLDIKIDSSAGWIKVYKDGIEILSFTGNTGNADILDLCFGWLTHNNHGFYYDDIYIDDTTGEGAAAVCPILRFYYVTPDEGGNYSDPGGWSGSDGNPTDNFLLVDDIPPNGDTDYISAVAADLLDSYTMTTIVLGSNEVIQAVIPTVSTRRAGTTEAIALGTRYSATDLIGSDQYPASSYDVLSERQVTKPGGGAWDQTALDAVEVVLKSRGTY